MLGAPPAFVLSQDQTLYKWYLSLKSVKSSSLSTQSLASCVNYFVWNCLTCFSNTKIGSVTSFSILFNFQGPARLSLSGWRLDYFTTEVIFCQALFFRSFSIFSNLWFVFQRIHIGSFALLPPLSEVILSGGPWRSSIIPYPDTFGNPFFHFFRFFLRLWLFD